jgi:hypothetical protein
MKSRESNSSLYQGPISLIMELKVVNHFLKVLPVNDVILGIKFPKHEFWEIH